MFIKNAEGLKTGLADKLLELLFRMYKVEIQSSSNVFHGFPKIRHKIKIYSARCKTIEDTMSMMISYM